MLHRKCCDNRGMIPTTDEIARIRDEVFWDLRHEDDKQVFEVWWTVNSAYPAMPLSDRLRSGDQAVRRRADDRPMMTNLGGFVYAIGLLGPDPAQNASRAC